MGGGPLGGGREMGPDRSGSAVTSQQTGWNANTNAPPLVSSEGNQGDYYRVIVAGTTSLDGIADWEVGDWAVFDSGIWTKVDNTESTSAGPWTISGNDVFPDAAGNDVQVGTVAGQDTTEKFRVVGDSALEGAAFQPDDTQMRQGGTLASPDVTQEWVSASDDWLRDNQNIVGSTVDRLGTDTGATRYQIQNASGEDLFNIIGTGNWVANPNNLFRVDAADGNTLQMLMRAHGALASGVLIDARLARGSAATPAIVQNGDEILEIIGRGHDGAGFRAAASISFQIDDVPGSLDMPGRIVWHVTPDGSNAVVERMRLNNAGQLLVGTSAPTGTEALKVDGDAEVTGKLTVGGLIDPTGLVLDEQTTVPGGAPAAGKGVFWARDDVPCVPMFTDDAGADVVLGASAVPTGNQLWVDVGGNDGTAVAGRFDLPYLTIGAALAAAAAGDAVVVRPGTYSESGLTVPAGVSLVGQSGFRVTTVGDAAAVAHIITMSDGSYLQGFAITLPTTALLAGVTHSAGTGTVYDLDFQGDAGTGSGTGLYKTGAGKVVGGNIRCSAGGMDNLLHVDAAVLALDDVHVPGSTGTIDNVILTEGTGRFQGQGINIGNSNVVDCIHVADTSTCIVYSPNWFNVPVGGHIADDGVTVTIVGGRIDATVASLLVDGALAGTGTTITVAGTTVQPLFSFPAAAITAMELNATIHQEQTSTRDAESRVLGADFVTGFPELGSGSLVGEGSPYSDGMVAKTTDSTAAPGNNGGAFVDVSTAAKSRDSSTFAFQGLTAGHSILWCTSRVDAASSPLKHWGPELDQVAAAVLGGGSFVWEIQTAANTWAEVGVMAVSPEEQYRYADSVFLRANSEETIRVGVDDAATWAATTIDGTLGRWMRVRIASTITTGPTFERMRLIPSHTSSNKRGETTARGLAQWRSTLFGAGNMWGEGGGAADYSVTVGSGSSAAGETWSHKNKKGRINNSNDFTNFNFIIPGGLCTAFPLKLRLLMSSTGAGNVDMRMSVLPLQALNNLIADPAGGAAPIARTSADAYDAIAAQVVDAATFSTVTDTLQAVEFTGFDISNFYSDDMLAIRVGFDPAGSARDVDIWALSIEGVKFTDGKIL